VAAGDCLIVLPGAATLDFVRKLECFLADGKNVAIHCRQGIGRSALIAACVLVAGVGPEAAAQCRKLLTSGSGWILAPVSAKG
jgi:predicted protein tyrosine phosphatase